MVARGLGRPAVIGAGLLEITRDGRSARLNGRAIAEGEVLSVDGDRGTVARGELPLAGPAADPWLERLLRWRSERSA